MRWISTTAGAAASLVLAGFALAASPGVSNVDLSGDAPGLAAAVPVVALDPNNPSRVVVAWRQVAPLAPRGTVFPGAWVCHISISNDGGKSFSEQAKSWADAGFSRCNAPFAAFSSKGDIYVGGTLTMEPPAHAEAPAASGPQERPHLNGAVGISRSSDGGKTWGPTITPIASNMIDRFEVDPSIPLLAKQVPWDGARAVVDPQTGAIYATGGFPAPPGGAARSQRFYTLSTDGGRTFGPIRSFGTSAWPTRWDGDIVAAHGLFAFSYVAEATPAGSEKCMCAVFGVSADQGKTVQRYKVADVSDFDIDTLVHYPELAADPTTKGRFGLTLISADKHQVAAYVTRDAGAAWRKSEPVQPADVIAVSRPAIAITPKGTVVLAWRGSHADGGYDIYAAAERAGDAGFSPAVKMSTATSYLADALKPTYALRGDFHTTLAATDQDVHAAWADARSGADLRVVYAKAPMAILLSK
jgi:hypothetical protein